MNRKLKIMANLLLTAAFAAVSVSCEEEPVQVTGVAFNRSTLALAVGEKETLTATVTPDDAVDRTLTWASSAPEVAVVDGGVVTAVAKGAATVTAVSANGKTAVCTVTVDEPEGPAITVRDDALLTQAVFADGTQGECVAFATTGAWTSLITEKTSSAEATDPDPEPSEADAPVVWISITPDHGDRAGDYTVSITLTPNLTGADRTAVITISCGGMEIGITVTQKAEREDGTIPNASAACDILSFSVDGEDWDIDGTDITHACPPEAPVTSLAPTITLSPGATVDPPSGAVQNFLAAGGVTYTVTAEDGVTTKTYTAIATVQAIASGITGECTWRLTGVPGNYTLDVSGNGAMGNYDRWDWYNQLPWYQYREDIKTIVIQDGVTTIGEYAFSYCRGLTSVSIPNSVTTIGYGTFEGCSSLTSVIIPNSVIAIGNSAFLYCRGLTSVSIGNSVKTIGDGAFTGCGGLTSVNIPNSVIAIGDSIFSGCSGLTSVIIPNSVTTIGREAFYYCSSLTSVSIPNSVTTIGSSTFSGCRGLTSVSIPNSVTTIGSYAFYSCGLTSVSIPNSVTTIGDWAFADCRNLTSVTIPNLVTAIGSYAFYSCGLTSVIIPNSVETIGYYAFYDCRSLTAIHVDAANAQYSSENGILFNKDKTTLVLYPAGKTGSYVIPNSVRTISESAFYGCSGLTSVSIGNWVTTIGYEAFYKCRSLTSVTIGNSVTTIGSYAFYSCGLTSVIIPNSVRTIDYSAFYDCRSLASVTIGNSVTTIGSSVFAYCSGLTTVTNLSATPQNINSNGVFSGVSLSACTLKVPASAVNTYKAAPVWSGFGNITANE